MAAARGFLIAWANAPFAIAAGVAAVFALLQVTGVLGLVAGGGDGDADHDVDGSQDHELAHDVDADHDAGGDHDADHDADDRAGVGWSTLALSPLGFGKLPFSMIWQTFALVFATIGFGLNLRFLNTGGPPLVSLVWTLPSAFVGAYVAVAGLARFVGPVFSSTEQEATSRAQLIGQTGVVISTNVDAEFGEVRIRDKSGHDLRVVCKLAPSAKGTPVEHEMVLVVDYTAEKGELLVEPFDFEDERIVPSEKAAARLR